NPKTIKNTRFVYEQVEYLMLILIVFLITSHYIACIWIFVGYESKKEKFRTSSDQLTTKNLISNGGFKYFNKY
ncbi:MAG: hypothetical protein ACK55Z_35100, partial [bacterium]